MIAVATIAPPIRRRRYEIRERNRHGKYVWYFRRPGQQRIRLPDDHNSPAYIKAYNAAFAGNFIIQAVGRPAPHTFAWLIYQYRQSGPWKALQPSTRRVRDNIFARLVETSGTQPFAAIKRQHMQSALDAKADMPFAANNGLKALRKLFEWAVSAGHVDHNPCDGVKPIKARTDGFHCWTVAEVEQFRERHAVGTRARLALDFMLFTGLRRSDAIRIGPQHVRDDLITIRTQKTGTTVYLTIWPELQRSIEAAPTGPENFIANAYGNAFATPESFGTWFAKQCDDAGLSSECRAHGLRKAGATIAANNGASAHELCAMFGWSKLATAEIYTKDADRRRLARAAGERIAMNGATECSK